MLLFEVADSRGVSQMDAGSSDVVQSVCSHLVQPELCGHLERLATDLDRLVGSIREHVVAGHLAEHRRLSG